MQRKRIEMTDTGESGSVIDAEQPLYLQSKQKLLQRQDIFLNLKIDELDSLAVGSRQTICDITNVRAIAPQVDRARLHLMRQEMSDFQALFNAASDLEDSPKHSIIA